MSRTLLVLVLMFGGFSFPAVSAQESTGSEASSQPEDVSAESLEELVARLEDPERRTRLIQDLKALVALQRKEREEEKDSAAGGFSGFIRGISEETRETASELVQQLVRIPDEFRGFWKTLNDEEQRPEILRDVVRVLGIVVVAALGGLLLWLMLRRLHRRLASHEAAKPSARLCRLSILTLLDALPPCSVLILGFVGVAVAAPSRRAAGVALAFVWAIALKHLVVSGVRAVLAPESPGLRMIPMGDELAKHLDDWGRRLTTIGLYGYFALVALEQVGVDPLLGQALGRLLGFLVVAMGVRLILKQRETARRAIDQKLQKTLEGVKGWRAGALSLLSLWWILAILYLVGLYVIWASGVERGSTVVIRATVLTLVAVLAGLGIAALGRWLVGWILGWIKPLRERFPEVGTSIDRYETGLRLLVNLTVGILSFCFVLEAWGVEALAVLGSETARSVFSVIVSILLIFLLAAATIDVATVLTQRYLESKERRGRATAKTRTILPLAQKAIKTVVVVLAAIMVLSEAGVNIGPLLAGVGVLGLAVGFGAQTLVKDVITGVFMLIEDTVSVGDVAVVNGTGGVVEAINIRTMRLRDLSANVHTIPYSTIGEITNMTKGFSRYLLEVGVAYREDTDEVVALLKELDAEMREDPEYKKDFIAPIEVLGVDRFEDSAVIVRARLNTKPSQQWRLGREFNRRMKKRFDERGIEIPFPHRTVYWGQDKQGTEPPLRIRSEEVVPRGPEREPEPESDAPTPPA